MRRSNSRQLNPFERSFETHKVVAAEGVGVQVFECSNENKAGSRALSTVARGAGLRPTSSPRALAMRGCRYLHTIGERPLLQLGHHLLDGCLADDAGSIGAHQMLELEMHRMLAFGLKPMIEAPAFGSSFLLPKLIDALTNTTQHFRRHHIVVPPRGDA